MPIYVYKNLVTGERFEIEQRITEPPLEEHPATGEPVKRLIQPVGIAFRGSGFYATDSRSSGSSKSASTPAADTKESSKESKPSDGAAAKPAATESAGASKPAKPSSSDS
jgi:predicted nucleic acid-binding Zn ribbon protein